MSKLEQRFEEDRALRDAAKIVLLADLEHAKASFSGKGLAERVGDRIGDGAKDVFEVAKVQADDNRGIIAALIGAILLWLGREPLLDLLGFGDEEPDTNEDHNHDDSAAPEGAETTLGDDHEQ